MTSKPWMIYGANGYTGALVAELARSRGHAPILAGRSADKVQPLAGKLGLPFRAFALDDTAAAAGALADVSAVLHCAGPFSATSKPMADACLAAGAHYLDLTGELEVIGALLARAGEAQERGVALLPAVGFDVVPTDCLAALLHQKLPSATRLMLAFSTPGRPSPGTLKTAVENLPKGGMIRRAGKLVRVPPAHEVREIPFPGGPRLAMSIPWGDLASAWASTGIPDITVFMAAPPGMMRAARLSRLVAPLLGLDAVQGFLKRRIDNNVRGPGDEARRKMRVELWGRVEAADGQAVEGTLTVPEGYTFTAEAALECTLRAVQGKVRPGAHTPAQAFGASFITELPGTELRL